MLLRRGTVVLGRGKELVLIVMMRVGMSVPLVLAFNCHRHRRVFLVLALKRHAISWIDQPSLIPWSWPSTVIVKDAAVGSTNRRWVGEISDRMEGEK